jgi:hypothetical protein
VGEVRRLACEDHSNYAVTRTTYSPSTRTPGPFQTRVGPMMVFRSAFSAILMQVRPESATAARTRMDVVKRIRPGSCRRPEIEGPPRLQLCVTPVWKREPSRAAPKEKRAGPVLYLTSARLRYAHD